MYGCPSLITTNRGPQFQSTLFSEFTCLLGVKHITTTAYHPCANGLVKRFHRQLKASLTATADNCSWLDRLPLVLLAFRNLVKEDIKCTSVELVFGRPLLLPGQMVDRIISSTAFTQFIPDLKDKMSSLSYTPRTANKAFIFS